jgi:hypothetical protein
MNTFSKRGQGAAIFGLAWLVLNAGGWGLGFGLQAMWMRVPLTEGLSSLLGVLIAAAVIGLAQWLALRWLLPRLETVSMGVAWVILTMFGFSAGFLAGSLVSGLVNTGTDALAAALLNFVAWGLVGLVTGFLQWSLLQMAVRGAPWWIGLNGIGYGLGAVLLLRLQLERSVGVFAFALAGLVVGAATLVAIARLRRPTQ